MKAEYLFVAVVLVLAFVVGSFPTDTESEIQLAIDTAVLQADGSPCYDLAWGDSRTQCIQSFFRAIDDSSVCAKLEENYALECQTYFDSRN